MLYRSDRPALGVMGWTLVTVVLSHLSAADWVQASRNASLTVYTREHPGNPVREIRAVGVIDAPAWVVRNVVNGVEDYPSFMPYLTTAKVVAAAPDKVVYLRLDIPVVGARDVNISMNEKVEQTEDGTKSYRISWGTAPTGVAASNGVTRIKLDEGSWQLNPVENGRKTSVTYTLFTDGGGGLPAFAVNLSNRQSVENLFQAVRKQVALAKYSEKKSDH